MKRLAAYVLVAGFAVAGTGCGASDTASAHRSPRQSAKSATPPISYRSFGVVLAAPPTNFSPRFAPEEVLKLYRSRFGAFGRPRKPVVALRLVRFHGRRFPAWVVTLHHTSPISYGSGRVPSTPICDSVAVFDLNRSAWATRFQACPDA
jgi:hypothetical protein